MVGLLVGSVVVVVEQKEEDEAQEVKLLDFNLMIFFKGQKLTKFFVLIPFNLRSVHFRYVQLNLCQKHLFLHQLTHNMTKDCSLDYELST